MATFGASIINVSFRKANTEQREQVWRQMQAWASNRLNEPTIHTDARIYFLLSRLAEGHKIKKPLTVIEEAANLLKESLNGLHVKLFDLLNPEE